MNPGTTSRNSIIRPFGHSAIRLFGRSVIAAALACAAADAFAVQGRLSTDTETLVGDIKWQPRSKMYIVSVKKGQTMIDMERKLADVTGLDIQKPQGLDKAVQQVANGQGASAIPLLAKIVAEYRMLQWDKPAGRCLAQAYLASDNAQKALAVCEPIVGEDKAAGWSGDLAAPYWQALLKLGKREQLEGLLKKAVASGDRPSSAAALVMRGDIIVQDSNDSHDKLKQALRDGYMRVVLMYQDAECARERREALGKAAACFDKIGQASRAEDLRAQMRAI